MNEYQTQVFPAATVAAARAVFAAQRAARRAESKHHIEIRLDPYYQVPGGFMFVWILAGGEILAGVDIADVPQYLESLAVCPDCEHMVITSIPHSHYCDPDPFSHLEDCDDDPRGEA